MNDRPDDYDIRLQRVHDTVAFLTRWAPTIDDDPEPPLETRAQIHDDLRGQPIDDLLTLLDTLAAVALIALRKLAPELTDNERLFQLATGYLDDDD